MSLNGLQDRLDVDRKGNTKCKNLEKGDVLASIYIKNALLYCDHDRPIMGGMTGDIPRYTCFYNGTPIKKDVELE